MAITLENLKSDMYIDIKEKTAFDAEIIKLMAEVISEVISYIDNSDKVATEADFTPELERKIKVQINKEFRRRHDPGLSTVTYSDGSINKFSVNEFLPEVKKVLDRYKRITYI